MGEGDAGLLARWRRGEPAAFAELVRRWQQPIARYLFRVTGRAELTRDLCQEVFLRVHQAADRYRDNGAFAAWIYRIALNVARDALRRRKHEPAPLLDAEPTSPAAPVDHVCQRRELRDDVARAVAELPEPLRVVVALRHDEGLSFEEIARLTGTAASTWKSRFAAALARLRERLRPLGYGPEETAP
jgi:RNA polymerase sigma-70 factor (ECF subfamily)